VYKQHAGGKEPYISAHHIDIAVGEVNKFENPIDHGIAHGDEGIDASYLNAVDKLLKKPLNSAQLLPLLKALRCRVAGGHRD
jgi:hypothetical protein